MLSIQAALTQAADLLAACSDSAWLDAEVLLCWVLEKNRSYLRTWPNRALDGQQTELFWAAIHKRQQGTPIAYITGHREFWSRDFQVTADVLIPRPDTELLVELALQLIPIDKPYNVIDLGTGSGIIAITLAAERPLAKLTATDMSAAALRVAQSNAERHLLGNIQFYASDWFSQIPPKPYDLVASNPPYIAEGDPHLQTGDLRFEPQTALVGLDNGLAAIKTLAEQARCYLQPGGHLLVEHGYNQQENVQGIFKNLQYADVQTYADLSGQPRVTYGRWLA